jgi:acyl carrier protein
MPLNDSVHGFVVETVSEILETGPEAIQEDTPFDDMGLDSLSLVELLVELERHYRCHIPYESRADLTSVRRVVEVVHHLLGRPAEA